MRLVRSKIGYQLTPLDMERTTGASLTVPDESLTIRQIMDKHSKGIPIANIREEQYDDDADFDSYDLEKLPKQDLFDVEMEKNKISSKTKEIQEKLEHEKNMEEDRLKAEEQELKEFRKALKASNTSRIDSEGQDGTNAAKT